MLDRLKAGGIDTHGDHDVFIHIFANRDLIPPNPDAEKSFADFVRGVHDSDPLLVYEDMAVSGPRATGGT